MDLTVRGIVGSVAVLLVAAACFRLGVWQLDRLDERRAHNQAVAQRLAQEPRVLESAPEDTSLIYRRAVVDGRADPDRTIVLAGRSYNGAPGVHVLTPLRTGAGAVLVNRGWLPAPDGATADLASARLEGRVRAEGVLLPFPQGEAEPPDGFQVRWFRVNGDAIRSQFPYPVAPLYLQATEVSGGSPSDALPGSPDPDPERDPASPPGPVPLGAPTLDAGPHLSYAIQWFIFGTIFLVGWSVVLIRRPGGRHGTTEARGGGTG